MAKEFLKIWFSDIETAHDFFDKNDKHLGEFLVNVYRSYAQLPTSFRCKHVEKYFKTYQKQIDFIKKAKADGMKAHLQETEREDFSIPTLEGGVKGVVEAPLPATLPAKGKKIKGKRIKGKEEIEILKENVEFLYSLYPSQCPEKKSSNGKCEKDKSKLEKLLKTKTLDELQELIQLYVEDCKAHKRYMRNFSTFLNNLPDKESFTKQEPTPAQTPTPTKPISIVHQSFPLPPQLPGTIRFRFKDDPSNITREMEKERALKYIENMKGGGYIAIML
jgi:hypothetical protein